MQNSYYKNSISEFLHESKNSILGTLTSNSEFDVAKTQSESWLRQIEMLQSALTDKAGSIYFEYIIPRIGKRVDVIVVSGSVVYVLEFKVGEYEYTTSAVDQVWDYALDLKNFHSTSHNVAVAPALIATQAEDQLFSPQFTKHDDKVLRPITINMNGLFDLFKTVEFLFKKKLLILANGKTVGTAQLQRS